MKLENVHVACSAIDQRIYVGTLNRDGISFESKKDITSDVLKSVIEYVGVGFESVISVEGKPKFKITVTEIKE